MQKTETTQRNTIIVNLLEIYNDSLCIHAYIRCSCVYGIHVFLYVFLVDTNKTIGIFSSQYNCNTINNLYDIHGVQSSQRL